MLKKNVLLIFVLVAALGLSGCFSFLKPTTPPVASKLDISAADNRNAIALSADDKTMELTALVKDKNNKEFMVEEEEITWEVSDTDKASLDSQTGFTVVLTAKAEGEVTVTAAYEDLDCTYKIAIFAEEPQITAFSEDFEEFEAGTPAETEGYTFVGNTEIVTDQVEQGDKALKLVAIEGDGEKSDPAEFLPTFSETLSNHCVSFLIYKPSNAGTFNVYLQGTKVDSGFQLTNGNGFRYRNTEGKVSSDTEIGSIPLDEWVRIEFEFDDELGKYSFYQGTGETRSTIGTDLDYLPGENGITGLRFRHQGEKDTAIYVDDIVVTDLTFKDYIF